MKTSKRKEKKKTKKVILIAFGNTERDARDKMARAKNTHRI